MPTTQNSLPEKRIGLITFLERVKRLQRRPPDTTEGELHAAGMQRLLTKIIPPEELRAVELNSAAFTRSVVEKFRHSIAEQKPDIKNVLANMAHFDNQRQPSEKMRTIPVDSIGQYELRSGALEPETSFFPAGDAWRDCHVHAEGSGPGWFTYDLFAGTRLGPDDQKSVCTVDYAFNFVPTITTIHHLESGVIASGPYFLTADDGWPWSKEAVCSITYIMSVYQKLPAPVQLTTGTSASYVLAHKIIESFKDGDDNILVNDYAMGITRERLSVLLYANYPVDVSVAITIEAYAKGAGSIADLRCARSEGGIFCWGLDIET